MGDEGMRYLYYPDDDECCACCDAAAGCGSVFPEWVTPAEYLGAVHVDDLDLYSWNVKGLSDNFYKETQGVEPLDRIPQRIDMGSISNMQFYPSTFLKTIDPETFNLPEKCLAKKKCPLSSICRALSGDDFDSQFL